MTLGVELKMVIVDVIFELFSPASPGAQEKLLSWAIASFFTHR